MKNLTVFAALLFTLSSVGCDRLSEKDKMAMIAMCDSESRKKIKEEAEGRQLPNGRYQLQKTTVTTHYSFSEKRCFALETTDVTSPYSISRTLYDGLTKQLLIENLYNVDEKGVAGAFTDNTMGLPFKWSVASSDDQKVQLDNRRAADEEIDRLMSLP